MDLRGLLLPRASSNAMMIPESQRFLYGLFYRQRSESHDAELVIREPTMSDDDVFRWIMIAGMVAVLPVAVLSTRW